MWLFNSSIGRKFVMAITGACLVLFVTFHVLMNSVALLWPTAYNQVCEFLGANWYALVASAGLAALFVIHIIYACWLTLQNRKARGNDRYAVTSRPPQVEWSSKNMLVLGIVILAFLVVHLMQFWYKMQWQEMLSHNPANWYMADGAPVAPAFGTIFIDQAFSCWCTPVIYIIGFVALWFHMNHGVWSMFHSVGWDGQKWLPRLKRIACWWTSIVVALFVAQAVLFTVQAHNGFFKNNKALQDQYAEYWSGKAAELCDEFQMNVPVMNNDSQDQAVMISNMQTLLQYLQTDGKAFVEKATVIESAFKQQCPSVSNTEGMYRMMQLANNIDRQEGMIQQQLAMMENAQPREAKPAPELVEGQEPIHN